MISCSHKVCNLRDQVRTNLPAHMYLINWSQDQTMRVHLFENFSTLLWNKLQILFHSPQLSELFKDFDHKSPIRIFFHWLQSILNVCVDFVRGSSRSQYLCGRLACIALFPHTNELFPTHLAVGRQHPVAGWYIKCVCALHIGWIHQPWNANWLIKPYLSKIMRCLDSNEACFS